MRILTLALILVAGQAAADVEGVWRTENSDEGYAHVTMAPCGAKICGTITDVYDLTGAPAVSEIVGKNIVWDMEPAGGNAWKNGQIWAPDTDKTYRSKMALSGDVLKVSGCVLGGIICRSQSWMRVK